MLVAVALLQLMVFPLTGLAVIAAVLSVLAFLLFTMCRFFPVPINIPTMSFLRNNRTSSILKSFQILRRLQSLRGLTACLRSAHVESFIFSLIPVVLAFNQHCV